MPLDRATAAFIENFARRPSKPLSETSVAEMREAVEALIPLGFEREDVHAIDNWAVDGVAVRSYLPSAQPLANVVYVHGGSFTRCGLHTHDTLCRRFANRSGCTVVAVDYSLAPEETYPRQLDEVARVLEVVARADPGRKLFVAGESSGGCLAAATALRDNPIRLDGVVRLPEAAGPG
ncbi:MAG TPA: alpha/beta hydrolase [Amycolatopsis sp.]|nr:alpha/beta hydrolase [Amycolatopsis sp.]